MVIDQQLAICFESFDTPLEAFGVTKEQSNIEVYTRGSALVPKYEIHVYKFLSFLDLYIGIYIYLDHK